MTAAAILDRLDRVRQVAPGRWVACCPCHESKSKASLAVREESDGRVLLHDFGGCAVADILNRLGLGFDALFPAERTRGTGWLKQNAGHVADDVTWSAADVLRACADDVLAAAIIASDLCTERVQPEAVRMTLWNIAQRLAAAFSLTQPVKRGTNAQRRARTV